MLREFLVLIGFQNAHENPSFYDIMENLEIVVIVVYVDEISIALSDSSLVEISVKLI